MGDAAGGEGVGQGPDHGLLADQVLKGVRPVFAGQDGVGRTVVGMGGGAGVGGRGGGHLRGGLRLDGRRRGRGGLGLAHAGGLGRAEHVVRVGIALDDVRVGGVFLPRRTFGTRVDVAHGKVLARGAPWAKGFRTGSCGWSPRPLHHPAPAAPDGRPPQGGGMRSSSARPRRERSATKRKWRPRPEGEFVVAAAFRP